MKQLNQHEYLMPEKSKALEYLTMLQGNSPSLVRQEEDRLAQALANPETDDAKRILSPYITERDKKHLEGYLNNYLMYHDRVPPNQSVINYGIMCRLKSTFDHVIATRFQDQHRYHISDKVDFGTLETPVLNGMITPVPESDEYLIILNRGLWESLRLYSFFLAASISLHQFPPRLDQHKAAKCFPYFTDMLRRILQYQDLPVGQPAITLTDEEDLIWNEMHEAMHAFLFGHEYAHLLHRHFDANSDLTSAQSDSGRLDHYESNWEKEYEADRTGLDLVVFRFLEDYHAMME